MRLEGHLVSLRSAGPLCLRLWSGTPGLDAGAGLWLSLCGQECGLVGRLSVAW